MTDGSDSEPRADVAPAAHLADRELPLDEHAEHRLWVIWSASRSVDTSNELFVGAILLGPMALAAVVLTCAMPSGDATWGLPLFFLWAVVLVGGGVVLWLRQRRFARFARQFAGLQVLAARLENGRVIDFPETTNWLSQRWPSPSNPADRHGGPEQRGVEGVCGAYRVLIDYEPKGRSDAYVTYPPRLLVYVACSIGTELTPSAAFFHAAATQAGFQLEIHPRAGIVARASSPPDAIVGSPSNVETLVALIPLLVKLADEEGAAPVP